MKVQQDKMMAGAWKNKTERMMAEIKERKRGDE